MAEAILYFHINFKVSIRLLKFGKGMGVYIFPRKYFFIFMFSFLHSKSWKTQLLEKIATDNPPSWMKEQIENDLAPFKYGIPLRMLDIVDEFDLAKFVIINGKVEAKPINLSVDFLFKRFDLLKNELISLSRVVRLPDMILLIDLSDGFATGKYSDRPIFTFSKDSRANSQGILIPDCFVLTMSKTLPEKLAIEGMKIPWNKKIPMAFWRGASTGFYFPITSQICNFYCTLEKIKSLPRYKLIEISGKFPDMLDAAFTRVNQACKKNKHIVSLLKELNFMKPKASIESHLAYKYQILIDGTTSTWERTFWQLWSNCSVLKQDSTNIQWYYSGLEPNIHYIPFAQDCSNLIDVITWAKNNDQAMLRIAENGMRFARNNLTYADIMFYLYYILNEYAKLQRFVPADNQDVADRLASCFSIY